MNEKKTKIGRFLQKLNFKKTAEVVGNVVTGNWAKAIDAISNKDNGLTPEQIEMALKELDLDMQEMAAVTQRWTSDMQSDSFLSKNVRPLSLIFLTVSTVILVYLDSFVKDVSVPNEWIDLLKSLLLGVYIAYFGSRGLEKHKAISKR